MASDAFARQVFSKVIKHPDRRLSVNAIRRILGEPTLLASHLACPRAFLTAGRFPRGHLLAVSPDTAERMAVAVPLHRINQPVANPAAPVIFSRAWRDVEGLAPASTSWTDEPPSTERAAHLRYQRRLGCIGGFQREMIWCCQPDSLR
jgi:hypothetical protein